MLPVSRNMLNLDDYCSDLVARMSTAWESAREHIKDVQEKQKRFHDRQLRPCKKSAGDRVMVYFLQIGWERHTSFRGPYQVQRLFPIGVEVSSLMKGKNQIIRVALNRVRRCPKELQLDEEAEVEDPEFNTNEFVDCQDEESPSQASRANLITENVEGQEATPLRRSQRIKNCALGTGQP